MPQQQCGKALPFRRTALFYLSRLRLDWIETEAQPLNSQDTSFGKAEPYRTVLRQSRVSKALG